MKQSKVVILIAILAIAIVGCGKPKANEGSFSIANPGSERIVNYKEYGQFEGIGTSNYKYKIPNAIEGDWSVASLSDVGMDIPVIEQKVDKVNTSEFS